MAVRLASAKAQRVFTPPKEASRAAPRGSNTPSQSKAVAQRALQQAAAPQPARASLQPRVSAEARPIPQPAKETPVRPSPQPLKARVTVNQSALVEAAREMNLDLLPAVPLNLTPPDKKKKSTEFNKELVELFRSVHPVQAPKKQNPSSFRKFLNKMTQPKNLCIIGAVAALKTAFAVLAVKVGPVAATHLIAQQVVAFVVPGVYVALFALEVALKAATTVIVHGLLPIVLPILAQVVVTTLAVALTIYVGYKLANAFLDMVPGGGMAKSLLGKIFKTIFSKEQPKSEEAPKSALGSVVSYFTGPKADEVAKSDSKESAVAQRTHVRPKPRNPLLLNGFRI